MDCARRRLASCHLSSRLCLVSKSEIDRPALPRNQGGTKGRPTMAEIPRKDRAAIKSDIALSRDRLGRELSGLRYELDIPRKLKFISRPNRDLDRSAGGGRIADRVCTGAKEKG